MLDHKSKIDVILPLSLLFTIFIVIFPFSSFFLDFCLIFNITFSIMLFFITILSKNILTISFFPSLLLYVTLFRLGLNLASTRLILTSGEAGSIITSLGAFIINSSFISGIASFIIIFFINYLLVAKGSERIAEVRARFTLELLPGKQISLDAEAVSGKITYAELTRRKEEIVREAEFYSSMEGSFKFIKGDIFVSVFLFIVNFVGACILGAQNYNYSELLILILGDGLISQLPSLLISTGASTLISRVCYKDFSFPQVLLNQIKAFPSIFTLGAFFPLFMLVIPKIPIFPVLFISFSMYICGVIINKQKEGFTDFTSFSHIIICINVNSKFALSEIKKTIKTVLLHLNGSLGVVFPKIKITKSKGIHSEECLVSLFGKNLTLSSQNSSQHYLQIFSFLENSVEDTINSKFFDNLAVNLKQDCGIFLDELIPKRISRDMFIATLKCLVREKISLNFLPKIVSILSTEVFQNTTTPIALSELIRKNLGSLVGKSILKDMSMVFTITIEEKLEQMLIIPRTLMNVSLLEKILGEIRTIIEKLHFPREKESLIILTSEQARSTVKRIVEKQFNWLPVLTYSELSFDIEICNAGVIEDCVLAL